MSKFYIDKKQYNYLEKNPTLAYKESFEFIDAKYFGMQYKSLKIKYQKQKNDREKLGIVTKEIVLTTGMALEALFSLLCSVIQAGHSYYAWLYFYRNLDLLFYKFYRLSGKRNLQNRKRMIEYRQ
jgi:hypothetical protein